MKSRILALFLLGLAPLALAQTPAPADAAALEEEMGAPATPPAPAAAADAGTTVAAPAQQTGGQTAQPPASSDDAALDEEMGGQAAPQAPAAGDDAALEAEMGGDDAALQDELAAEEGKAAAVAGPTLPKGFTGVYGQVTDAKTQEALIEATVKVVSGGPAKQALTDVDGFYVLALPPGTYDLRVFYEIYQGRRVSNVKVEQGKPVKLDVGLESDAGAIQEVVVEVKADKRSEGALLTERKKAAAVSDAISSQEIARTPDSSAGDAVKRVVSATIVDGKYVLLRGLGGRYSQTLLNGALLPSPEPDEPSVPLDIFPTNLLANLNVLKSYTADLPGTFAGGTLVIETNSYPSKFEFRPRVSISGDSQTTFQSRNSQPGSWLEGLGLSDSSRSLPGQVPTDGPVKGTAAEREAVGESFTNIWSARHTRAVPNMSLGASVGDTLRFGNRRLGYLATLNYGRKESILRTSGVDVQQTATQPNGDPVYGSYDPTQALIGTETTQLSGLVNVGYQFDTNNELTFFSLYTRGNESRVATADVFASQSDNYQPLDVTRLQFITRALSFNQLRGFHRLDVLGDAELDYQANYSRVDRSEPDTRDVTYYIGEDDRPRYRDQPGSGDRFFSDLGENSGGGSLNLTIPFSRVRLKLGGLAQLSRRSFNARRFRFDYTGGAPDAIYLPPEELFSKTYVGQNVRLQEQTFPEDQYNADLNIFAGFVNLDANLLESLRFIGGVRYEVSNQTITAASPFTAIPSAPKTGNKSYQDILPTANLVLAVGPSVNLRAGYSYTLARPTFRELAPFLFYDIVRRRAVSGNEALVESRIHNADLRAEWFVGENEVLAASVFGKQFLNPIERVAVNYTDLSFRNTPSAISYGLELEARASLGRISPALSNFRVASNLTLIKSEVDLGEGSELQTSRRRPLQGQSPYVVNVNLSYVREQSGTEVGLLYNVYGERLSEAGVAPIPDVYEQAFHRVDAVFSQQLGGGFQLKLTGSNLLDSKVVLKQAGFTSLEYKPGLAFSASLGWTL